MGTAWAARIDGADAFGAMLASRYAIHDLEPLGERLQRRPPLRLQMAAAELGEVVFTSVLGDPLSFAVNPLQPLCLLALPSVGWGQYQLDDDRLDNSAGQTVAYLPPPRLAPGQ